MGKPAQMIAAQIVSLTLSKAVLFGSYPLLNDFLSFWNCVTLGKLWNLFELFPPFKMKMFIMPLQGQGGGLVLKSLAVIMAY